MSIIQLYNFSVFANLHRRNMKKDNILQELEKFSCYAELRDFGLKSDKNAQLWFDYLKNKRERMDAINSAIKDVRKKSPGTDGASIVKKYKEYFDKHFPMPTWSKDDYDYIY